MVHQPTETDVSSSDMQNQNALTAENKKLQAVIWLQKNYVEEYSCAHNSHQLSDLESEDDDMSGTLEFSSSLLFSTLKEQEASGITALQPLNLTSLLMQRSLTLQRYPDTKVEYTWLQELWDEACEEFGEVYELIKVIQTMVHYFSKAEQISDLIDARLSNVTYGFVVSSKKAMIEQNKKKYVLLVTCGAFTCKVPGIIWEDDFDCIKPETVTLVVTIPKQIGNRFIDDAEKE
ncbi:hypothetical protein EDD85DRAFT_934740 [Armillaria nabsnona]|nr:hypothetical protein EDD85DRAFT_934740 [Armillaria nabsnona]